MKRWHLFLGGSVLIGLSFAGACATSDSDYGGAGGSTSATQATGLTTSKASSGATTGSKASSTATNGPATSATNGPSTGSSSDPCAMMATYADCAGCYCDANQAGCDAYYMFEDEACLCGAGAPCQTQCADTFCAGGEFDGTCGTCYDGLTGNETCFETAFTNCEAQPACNTYLEGEFATCGNLP